MIPTVKVTKGTMDLDAGSMSRIPVRQYFGWKLPKEVTDAILNINQETEVLKEYLKALLLIGMFFTGFTEKKLQIKLDLDNEASTCVFYMKSDSEDHVCFNILNFVLNLYDADEYLSSMKEKLTKLGTKFAGEVSGNYDEDCRVLQEELKERQIELNAVDEKLKKIEQKMNAYKISSEFPDVSDEDRVSYSVYQDRRIDLRVRISEIENELKLIQAYMELMTLYGLGSVEFTAKWKQIVEDLIAQFEYSVSSWRSGYGKKHAAVLPVEHFDMMYNIIKRLANRSYYDMPEQMHIEEVYDYCVKLYKRIAEELSAQDKVYGLTGRESFANACFLN